MNQSQFGQELTSRLVEIEATKEEPMLFQVFLKTKNIQTSNMRCTGTYCGHVSLRRKSLVYDLCPGDASARSLICLPCVDHFLTERERLYVENRELLKEIRANSYK